VTGNDNDTEAGRRQRIALVTHDGRNRTCAWAEFNRDLLAGHQLYATGTTGRMLSEELGLPVTRLCPKTGDLQRTVLRPGDLQRTAEREEDAGVAGYLEPVPKAAIPQHQVQLGGGARDFTVGPAGAP